MLERAVEDELVRAGERRGCWILKLKILGRSGFPDRLCLAPGGRVAFVELKRPGKKLEKLQGWVRDQLRRLGFVSVMIDRPEECEPFFEEWLGPC